MVALLFVSGLGASWLIPLNVSFVQAVPAAYRGRAFGVAVSGLYGVQALGALAAGLRRRERFAPAAWSPSPAGSGCSPSPLRWSPTGVRRVTWPPGAAR